MSHKADKPYGGIIVASPLPFREDGKIDFDAYSKHILWLAEQGMHGVTPNGTLGEYQALTDDERAQVLRMAAEVKPKTFKLMPGVAGYGADAARRWTEHAAECGADAVLLLPPTGYSPDAAAVINHYKEASRVGLPIVAYGAVGLFDLSPTVLKILHNEGYIAAVKWWGVIAEVQRVYETRELAPGLDIIVGSDDVLLESVLAGAVGWNAGVPNSFPASSLELYNAAQDGDLETALPLYRKMHPLFRWDARREAVQAMKLMMSLVGQPGGICRSPLGPLSGEQETTIRSAVQLALSKGLS